MAHIGRNDPCPCGSGKKYKKCCLAETFQQVGREESIRRHLVDELLSFYNKNYDDTLGEAHVMFWDDFVPQEHLEGVPLRVAYQNFFEWIIFDFIIEPDTNKTLIDLYMEKNKKMQQDEHKVLTSMKNAVISLYEVQEVFPEKGLLLKDLLMGGEYDVKEKVATGDLKRWDIFAARLLLIDGQYVISGSSFPYSIMMKQKILDDIMDEYREYQEEFSDGTMDMFLKESGDIFNFHWYFPIQNPPPPLNLHTTSGEPVVFSEALFEIKDHEAVRIGLPTIKGIEQDQDDYTWYDKRKQDGSATILGTVEIKDNKLTLVSNSKKRLQRGKKLILGAVGGAVVHKIDTFQDPMEAIKAHKEQSPEHEDDLPMEVQQQLYSQFMQNYHENGLVKKSQPLTTRLLWKLSRLKKVIELLKLYENVEERKKGEGRPHYDLAWVWQRLGIEKE
jgi:hypothetical protein